ncbi:MAG: DNA polymerase III subunit beta, partial [Patescibacteria group bacterium]
MKIECIKDKLTWGLDKVAKIAGKNLTLPILSCVLFEAKKGLLKIKATNLDFGVEVSIPVKVIEEGILAVPGNVAANFIENINDRTVLLEEKENNLTITTERNKTIIKTHNHSDFPNIPSPTKEFSVKINAKDFINGLASVWYSASTSTIKPELSSVHIYEQNDEMIFVATDSFRLAEKKIKIKKHDSFSPVLIPNKN